MSNKASKQKTVAKENMINEISTAQALAIAKERNKILTRATMNNWCKKYHIGIKIGGMWTIYRDRLLTILEGKKYNAKAEQDS